MPPMIKVQFFIWVKGKEETKETYSFEKEIFLDQVSWACVQYADVNEALCEVYHNGKLLVSCDKRI